MILLLMFGCFNVMAIYWCEFASNERESHDDVTKRAMLVFQLFVCWFITDIKLIRTCCLWNRFTVYLSRKNHSHLWPFLHRWEYITFGLWLQINELKRLRTPLPQEQLSYGSFIRQVSCLNPGILPLICACGECDRLPCWLTRDQQVIHLRWSWRICCVQVMNHASERSTLALKPMIGITKGPQQGYHWLHKKDSCPLFVFKQISIAFIDKVCWV